MRSWLLNWRKNELNRDLRKRASRKLLGNSPVNVLPILISRFHHYRCFNFLLNLIISERAPQLIQQKELLEKYMDESYRLENQVTKLIEMGPRILVMNLRFGTHIGFLFRKGIIL